MKRKQLEVLRDKAAKMQTVDPKASEQYLKEYIALVKELGGSNG